jgi:hypothetical protein
MTREGLTRLLAERNDAVERALVALYRKQTSTEQASRTTNEENGQGFNGVDADILTSYAEQVLGIGSYEYKGKTYQRKGPKSLTPAQLVIARKKLPKYVGQLVRIAAEKRAQAATGAPSRLEQLMGTDGPPQAPTQPQAPQAELRPADVATDLEASPETGARDGDDPHWQAFVDATPQPKVERRMTEQPSETWGGSLGDTIRPRRGRGNSSPLSEQYAHMKRA